MTFKNFLCWNPDKARRWLNAEAEQKDLDFFSATHSPVSAQRMIYTASGDQTAGRFTNGNTISEQEILSEFMVGDSDFDKPNVEFDGNIFMPIIGPSGSGKTHLIKWLRVKIPDTPKRTVILVPRLNTSLKQILTLMIGKLQGTIFDEFRNALKYSVENTDQSTVKDQLVAMLAISVAKGAEADPGLGDHAKYIRKGLNALLTDQYFRDNWWLVKGGFIDRVASNASGNSQVVLDWHNTGNPYDFTEADLPMGLSTAKVNSDAGREARFFFNHLNNTPQDLSVTVKIIKSQLEDAMTNLLQLGGLANLTVLMTKVRQQYKRDGKELVVLIEDFARLQGVDQALLGALLLRTRQQGEDDLCDIRTALACTTGYYSERVPDTAKTRATLHLQIGGLVDDSGSSTDDWRKFAGRYLNALRRFTPDVLQTNTPNPCGPCEHKTVCHKAFGTVRVQLNDTSDQQTIGLYPLNQALLNKSYKRILSNPFNPRKAMVEILKPILADYGGSISNSQFPPRGLVTSLGGPDLTATTRDNLNTKADSDRQMNLVDLWSSTTDATGVGDDVRMAFDIAKLDVAIVGGSEPPTLPPEVPTKPIHSTPTPASPIDHNANELIEALDTWANGNQLSDKCMRTLKERVFEAIEMEIDWVRNGLYTKFHAQPTAALFRRESIFFDLNKEPTDRQVRLNILSTDKDAAESAVALQALVNRHSKGSWDFADGTGTDQYIKARNKIHKWATDVLEQICLLYGPNCTLDPIAPAVESLCLAHILNGKTLPHGFNDMTAIQFLFQKIDTPSTARSQRWQDLQNKLSQHIHIVRISLLNLVGCTKGEGETYMVAADRVLPLIRRALENYKPTEFKLLPLAKAGVENEGLALRRCNEILREYLKDAVADEIKASADCGTALEDLFGLSKTDQPSAETISNALEKTLAAVNKAKDLGNLGGNLQVDQLRDSIRTLRLADLGNLLKACRLVREETGCNQLPVAANVDAAKRQTVVTEVKNLSACLDATHERLTEKCTQLTEDTGINSSITQIVKSLNSLKQVISTLQTGSI
jgi:hypothetical protein